MASKSHPASAGGLSPSNGARSPVPSSPASSDQSPGMKSREKPRGLHDEQAQMLEREFKTRHLGLLGVLTWIL